MKKLLLVFALPLTFTVHSCYEPDAVRDEDLPGLLQQSCFDGVASGGETSVDCGGPCPPCASCSDGVQNQGEVFVDCGGPCPACPSCFDGIQNQGETGIDCGGPCPDC